MLCLRLTSPRLICPRLSFEGVVTLLQAHQGALIPLRLARDLTRAIKRGQPWVFAESLRQLPPARPGAQAVLLDNKKGRELAHGFYDLHSPLAFRVCAIQP